MDELTPADFDELHRALGHPRDPRNPTSKNYLAVMADPAKASRLRSLGFWLEGASTPDGQLTIFHVTAAGIEALAEWMKLREIR